MAIPDYEALMLPLLETIADGRSYKKREVDDILAKRFRLTEDELRQTVATGSNLFSSRVHWAITYMYNAGLVTRPERAHVQITKRGKDALKSGVKQIDNRFLSQFPEFQQWKERPKQETKEKKGKTHSQLALATLTPDEQIDAGYQELRDNLAADILHRVQNCTPRFFERLVVQLLLRMGYGGSLPGAGRVTGKSGDGGIDGLIKEDKLGLDVIYVQAKRWEKSVGSPEVSQFLGAVGKHGAKKGVMIATSQFTEDARDFISSAKTDIKIILVDGKSLADLMIEHDVGVSTVNSYAIKRIDSDYFEED